MIFDNIKNLDKVSGNIAKLSKMLPFSQNIQYSRKSHLL